jgi:tetratricopeptide (TPR) repeat protein
MRVAIGLESPRGTAMKAKLALFLSVSLVMGLVLHVRVAHGQDAATEEARAHFRKGQQFFDVGRWDEAADEFEKAYAVRNDPTFLFNMAQAYRRKGDARRAIDLYKNYLIKAPKTPQRADVEERIRALQKQLDEAEPAVKAAPLPPPPVSVSPPAAAPTLAPAPIPAPTPVAASAPVPAPAPEPAPAATPAQPRAADTYPAAAAPPPAPVEAYPAPAAAPPQPAPAYVQVQAKPAPPVTQSGQGLRVAGIITAATGLAAVTAAIVCGAEAKAYSDSVQSGTRYDPHIGEMGRLFETLQWVGYGVGAALVATGAALYSFGAASANRPGVAFAPVLLPAGAGFSAQGAF